DNGNGIRDGTPNDLWITYRLLGNNVMRFCSNQTCAECLGSTTPPAEDVSRNIKTFIATKSNTPLDENNVTVALTACRDPSIPESVNNPCMSMESRIVMSSVSTN
ncbi:MAG: hypothetical protein KJ923_00930, partial [Candidatus Omnitrophica bacterium]|nr:hypothetical protein [Candidatus Omnitrophota bacterium]